MAPPEIDDRLYVSTTAFERRGLEEIVAAAKHWGLKGLELSGKVAAPGGLAKNLTDLTSGLRILVHNYFPPEDGGLVINLASIDPGIRRRSIQFCRRAIDWCRRLKSPCYSVHAGFCVDPAPHQLGQDQTALPRIDREAAKELFYSSLQELAAHAAAKGITLCVENNVIEARNLIRGRNLTDLLTGPADCADFLSREELSQVDFLIDFGHLKVSARSESFSADEFLALVAPRTRIIHLSDNDGRADQHRPFDQKAWFIERLPRFRKALAVLEAQSLSRQKIEGCLGVMAAALGGH